MEYLIVDTHICLWAISDYERLSSAVRLVLEDGGNKIFVSQVSLYEIVIKQKVGKLPEFAVSLAEFISSVYEAGFELLPLKNEHLISYSQSNFPEEHRDPFDRLIIATALFEKLAVITRDKQFRLYKDRVKILW